MPRGPTMTGFQSGAWELLHCLLTSLILMRCKKTLSSVFFVGAKYITSITELQSRKQLITGWWFQIFFYVHSYLRKMSNLTNIFFKWVETTNQIRINHWMLGYWTNTCYGEAGEVLLMDVSTDVFLSDKMWLGTSSQRSPLHSNAFLVQVMLINNPYWGQFSERWNVKVGLLPSYYW